MKDKDGLFIRCDRRLEEFHGLPPGGATGRSDHDLHDSGIADQYRAEDMEVMKTGAPTPNRTWMVPGAKGVLRWWVSRKTPVRSGDGSVSGVAGVMYEIPGAAGATEPFARIEPALKLIHAEDSAQITTTDLAAACNYSDSQFNRVFAPSWVARPGTMCCGTDSKRQRICQPAPIQNFSTLQAAPDFTTRAILENASANRKA